MSWKQQLERRFRRLAIPNLTGFLAGFQGALWLLIQVIPRRVGQDSILGVLRFVLQTVHRLAGVKDKS